MYYSKKLNILFIASPKSGSQSIQKYLMSIDPQGETHKISLEDKKITSKDMHYGVVGHARAWELKKALGEDIYNKLNVIGLVRHPFDKLISSYFYNRKAELSSAFNINTQKSVISRKLKIFMTFLAPKILPLSIWALVYPMKSSYEYFFDRNGNRIVKYLGRTDHLESDINIILQYLHVKTDEKLPHINTSEHKSREKYFRNSWIKNRLMKKYTKDIELYKTVESELSLLQTKDN